MILRAVLCAGAMLVVGSAGAYAIPVSEVSVGATYSLSGIGENRTVTVVRVNRSTGRVLVRFHHNNREEWVSSSRLLRSHGESFADDAAETAVWGLLIAGLLSGLSDDSGSTRSSTSSFDPYRVGVDGLSRDCRQLYDEWLEAAAGRRYASFALNRTSCGWSAGYETESGADQRAITECGGRSEGCVVRWSYD